jgi:hypothetical protein
VGHDVRALCQKRTHAVQQIPELGMNSVDLPVADSPTHPLHSATLRALQFALAVATSGPGNPLPQINKPPNGAMSDEFERFQAEVTNGQSTQIAMDEAFCLRMRAAIEAGLESAPIGVVSTPGTKNPRYVPTEPRNFPRPALHPRPRNFQVCRSASA